MITMSWQYGLRPVVCMDETPKQLIKEVHKPLSMKPGFEKKADYEYSVIKKALSMLCDMK